MTSIQTPLAQVLTSDVTSNVNFDETEVSNKIRFSVTSHQALIITAFHEPLSIANIPIPVVKDNDILVRNRAIGLNPIDWKGKKYRFGVYDFLGSMVGKVVVM